MSEHKITYQQLLNFAKRAEIFLSQVRPCHNAKSCAARIMTVWKHCPNCGTKQPTFDQPERTKFRYVLERNLTLLKVHQEKLEQRKSDILVRYALEDDDKGKALRMRDDNQYDYDRDGTEKTNKELADLLKEKIVINPIFAAVVPNSLTDIELEDFSDIAIVPATVDRIRAERDSDLYPGVMRMDRDNVFAELFFKDGDGGDVGRIRWDGKTFAFNGNADEAAAAFLDAVNIHVEPGKVVAGNAFPLAPTTEKIEPAPDA